MLPEAADDGPQLWDDTRPPMNQGQCPAARRTRCATPPCRAVIVLVLIAAAPGLRGHVTRWLVEIAPGVFAGTTSARVRDRLWDTVSQRVGDGQAVLVRRARNEQGWATRTAGRDRWWPVDLDGLILIERPRG